MKKIEAYIRPDNLLDVKGALSIQNVNGMTITQVMGFGNQKGWKEIVRGTEVDCNLVSKIKIELFILDEQVDDVVKTIIENSQTGEFGDGKIFISGVEDAVRIRTGERGVSALH